MINEEPATWCAEHHINNVTVQHNLVLSLLTFQIIKIIYLPFYKIRVYLIKQELLSGSLVIIW